MIKLFYALKPELLEGYKQTKDDLLKARSEMSDQSISEAKAEIIRECKIYDYDPESTDNLYTVENGIANIPIAGMLVNKVDICAAFFGETLTTYRFIQEAVKTANDDPQVEKILFHVNSGGGIVAGCDLTSQIIAGCKKKKYAAVYDMAASACYWLISQCDEIISVSNSGFIGSIGVAAEIINRDKFDESKGIKRRTITNTESKNKRPDLETDEGLKVFVDELNSIYRVFTSTILKKREGKLTQKKIDDLFGKVLIAEDAIDYGLVDRFIEISELNNYVEDAEIVMSTVSADEHKKNINALNKLTPSTGKNSEGNMNKLDEFLAQNPDAKADYDQKIETAKKEGFEAGKSEFQERIKKVTPILSSDVYDSALKSQAQKVLEGKISIEAFESIVAMEDMRIERSKSDLAKNDTDDTGDTPPDSGISAEKVSNVRAQEDMKKAARYS